MEGNNRWTLSPEEKEALIAKLTPELNVLRTKAGISQGELANILGVSRQTYGAIEREARTMTWNTYMSLIMFYDHDADTHDFIRKLEVFPLELIERFNHTERPVQ